MEKNSKIILTGYRATGKSTVGRLLADKLGWKFIDTDQEIEKKQRCSIAQMVSAHGWDFFRGLEEKMLFALVPARQAVVATGGGAILHKEAWSRLMATSLIIWLRASPETICERLTADRKTAGQRPSLTDSDIYSEVESVLAAREQLYRQGSHLAIDTTISAEDMADKIIKIRER